MPLFEGENVRPPTFRAMVDAERLDVLRRNVSLPEEWLLLCATRSAKAWEVGFVFNVNATRSGVIGFHETKGQIFPTPIITLDEEYDHDTAKVLKRFAEGGYDLTPFKMPKRIALDVRLPSGWILLTIADTAVDAKIGVVYNVKNARYGLVGFTDENIEGDFAQSDIIVFEKRYDARTYEFLQVVADSAVVQSYDFDPTDDADIIYRLVEHPDSNYRYYERPLRAFLTHEEAEDAAQSARDFCKRQGEHWRARFDVVPEQGDAHNLRAPGKYDLLNIAFSGGLPRT